MSRSWRSALCTASAIMLTAAPARAANCWRKTEVAAARLREMQTLMMVATLRCHAGGRDILAHYNRFITARRAMLAVANDQLRKHFFTDGRVGQRAYDRYTTRLANRYGSGETGPESCGEAADLADEAATAETSDLSDLTLRAVPIASMVDASCPAGAVTLAAR